MTTHPPSRTKPTVTKLLALIAVCLAIRPVAATATSARPNIIFLLTDDQRWDTLRTHGNHIFQTPDLDRLASEGLIFDNAFVTTATSMTGRATIFTGQLTGADRAEPSRPGPRMRFISLRQTAVDCACMTATR